MSSFASYFQRFYVNPQGRSHRVASHTYLLPNSVICIYYGDYLVTDQCQYKRNQWNHINAIVMGVRLVPEQPLTSDECMQGNVSFPGVLGGRWETQEAQGRPCAHAINNYVTGTPYQDASSLGLVDAGRGCTSHLCHLTGARHTCLLTTKSGRHTRLQTQFPEHPLPRSLQKHVAFLNILSINSSFPHVLPSMTDFL